MSIKAILFDHDGTLVNSESIHFDMWKIILESYGVALSIDEYTQQYAGVPTVSNARKMVDFYPSLTVSASTLEQDKNSATEDYLSTEVFPLMQYARETISFFKQKGLEIAVVTGAGGEGVRATVNAYNLQQYLSTVVSGDDVENSKPAPDCYLLAALRLGLKPSECIAIEDTENGVAAAAAANILCVAVSSALSQHHDFSKAVIVVENLDQAKNWIVDNYKFSS